MSGLAGKVALVTGASRGIGQAIALRLAKDGATVAVHYNASVDAANATVAAIATAGGNAFAIKADLSERGGAAALAADLGAELTGRHGSPAFDILVNNAGVGKRATIEDISEDDFDLLLQTNLKSPFFLIKALMPHLRNGGRIINISSMGTRSAYPTMAAYAPAKAGLEALSRLLAVHLGGRQITVNSVMPGATATDMNIVSRDPVASRAVAETVALGRIGQPDDIARVVAFLASDEAGWVTGQQIDASGGQRL
ncbi:NAD(P)-dependent dehydrogenase, short-chain alcohol dehydrogenase family [Bradyrhizobium sp. NFR13]|jgi:NAD(P)-dependent dehydrogenase (short-subunit alcohol dehydrogenase family)|uniref:SDR family NAD(P)-dependent oxidoreductase n=1 Tax=Bradyrhizobium sp. NFR13 TaxID=1566285 RepID=UPI0008E02333|nr:SDR family oxidoreductase [Bradyrhizobium sp. NFR13]SFL76632.1 NAD(P)-dependent dehydrogenase, short-chain alcohol dehydrogenase family [Bradyrhizobium sp. NFR13]